jgi:hypothetical protein
MRFDEGAVKTVWIRAGLVNNGKDWAWGIS